MPPVKHSGRTETLMPLPANPSSGCSRILMMSRRVDGFSFTDQSAPLNRPLRLLLRRHTSLSPVAGSSPVNPRRWRIRML